MVEMTWGVAAEAAMERGGIQGSECDNEQSEESDAQAATLARLIQGEVIPRLMLAHANYGPALGLDTLQGAPPTPQEVVDLSALLVQGKDVAAEAYVERVLARGVHVQSLLLDLLAPTARRLGELWNADLCTFTDVTLGLLRLQHLLRTLAPRYDRGVKRYQPGRRILLTAMPGEQHTFGVIMVAEFFRRAGWEVHDQPHDTTQTLLGSVAAEWFSSVGLSVSAEVRLTEVTALIPALRENSRNAAVAIMIGGGLFKERPELVELVGADFGAIDALSAVDQAERMFGDLHVP